MQTKNHTQKESIDMKFLIFVLSLALYSFNYQLCEYFFADNIEAWWKLKYTIFSFIVFLLVGAYKVQDKGIERERWSMFAVNWFIGVMAFDIIDRCFFEPVLNWNDWIGLLVSGLIAWYKKNK